MATLTIKNESGAKLALATPAGQVELEPGAQVELSDRQLGSQDLADALYSGKVAFVIPGRPAKEQVELAKAVLPRLAAGSGTKLTQAKARFDQSQKELMHLRQAFNKTWKAAEIHLGAAKATAAGWPGLRRAIKALILDTEEEDRSVKEKKEALTALEKELEELKALGAEDLAVQARTLDDWYKDRVVKEHAVQKARDAWEKVSKEKTNPLIAQMDALDAGAGAVRAIAKDDAIGREVPEFGR